MSWCNMIANILQLSAGILLAISSFVVKLSGFQVPVFGKKLPGSFEKYKQTWLVRFGLSILAIGYAFPIIDWDIQLPNNFSIITRLVIGFGFTGILVLIFYKLSIKIAKRECKREPEFDEHTRVPEGTIAIEIDDTTNT